MTHGGPLEPSLKEQLLVLCLRAERVLDVASGVLVPEHFSREDQHYALLWRTLVRYYRRYRALPDRSTFTAEVEAEVAACAGYLDDEEIEQLNELLELAYTCTLPEEDEVLVRWGQDVAGRWASEGLARKAQEELAQADPTGVTPLLRRFIEYAEQIRVRTSPAVTGELFSAGWNRKGPQMVPTGIDFLDELLSGGEFAGEAYGVLGPQGSCKTVLAVHLLCEGVRSSRKVCAEAGDPAADNRVYYLVSYEGPELELKRRIIANLADVSLDSLRLEDDENPLSTADNLKPYEHKLLYNQSGGKLGEVERQEMWIPYANRHIGLIMLDGSQEELQDHGGGGVEEIAALIERDLQSRPKGMRVGRVVIDFLGAMVLAMLADSRRAREDRPLAIMQAVAQLKRQIAVRYNCPIWIIHQLSGVANSRRSGWIADDTDAEGGKSYAQRLDYSLSISEPDDSRLIRIRATKHRRSSPPPDQIVFIDGEFARLRSANETYVFDPTSRRILPRHEYKALAGPGEVLKQVTKPGDPLSALLPPEDLPEDPWMSPWMT